MRARRRREELPSGARLGERSRTAVSASVQSGGAYASRIWVSGPRSRFSTCGRAVEYSHGAAVLRPAGDVVADRDRPLLAVADRLHARSGDALGGEIVVHRLGALGAEGEIIFA